MTYKELFVEYNKEYIFSIVFSTNQINKDSHWILGKPFMKKYQLVYDLDRKIIGLYKNNNKKKKSIINPNTIIYTIILSVLVLIIIGLGFYIFYLFKKPRKNKAFELDDENYEYNPIN